MNSIITCTECINDNVLPITITIMVTDACIHLCLLEPLDYSISNQWCSLYIIRISYIIIHGKTSYKHTTQSSLYHFS